MCLCKHIWYGASVFDIVKTDTEKCHNNNRRPSLTALSVKIWRKYITHECMIDNVSGRIFSLMFSLWKSFVMLREKIAGERKLRFILQSIIKGVNMKSRQFLLPLKCCILRYVLFTQFRKFVGPLCRLSTTGTLW